ncbi:MAG TPA: hypothetical protein VEU47_00100, partial [Candidatus Cybelea sp.]|nr:hypothetical protein [Candidatus Cybelea sp.]
MRVRELCLAAALLLSALSALAAGSVKAAETPANPAAPPAGLETGQAVPSGQRITPTAAPGALFQPLNPDLPNKPDYLAGQAVTLASSPDGATLLVLTSGFNRNFDAGGKVVPDQSREYVFVYDIAGPAPAKRQVIQVPNTFIGLSWLPDGKSFAVAGGVNDNVHLFTASGDRFE